MNPASAIAANRFGLGARPGELEKLADPPGWLMDQLKGAPPALRDPALRPSSETLARIIELRREAREQRDQKETDGAQAKAAVKLAAVYRPIYFDEAFARFAHAVGTDRPFVERLTQFWSNHFAVSVDKVVVLGLAGAMEREAIRPHVTGHFADLLLAVEKHPAMLLYLDNQTSIGPNSKAAQFLARRSKRKADINENLAREILELHTHGVNGGYSQSDVTTFAKAISGWSVGGQDQGRRLARLGFSALDKPRAKTFVSRTRRITSAISSGVTCNRIRAKTLCSSISAKVRCWLARANSSSARRTVRAPSCAGTRISASCASAFG
jgi:uncharacterized protein (DUF1800 family)